MQLTLDLSHTETRVLLRVFERLSVELRDREHEPEQEHDRYRRRLAPPPPRKPRNLSGWVAVDPHVMLSQYQLDVMVIGEDGERMLPAPPDSREFWGEDLNGSPEWP